MKMNVIRTAHLVLALDVGAVWTLVCLTLGMRAERAARPAEITAEHPPVPVPDWAGPTALVPLYAPVDPWAGACVTPVLAAVLPAPDYSTRAVPVWAGPTMRLPVAETRRRITPPAPEPEVGRYIEMILTPRTPSPLPC